MITGILINNNSQNFDTDDHAIICIYVIYVWVVSIAYTPLTESNAHPRSGVVLGDNRGDALKDAYKDDENAFEETMTTSHEALMGHGS